MATALDYITRALRLNGIIAPGEAPEAGEAQDALSALNAMLNAWGLENLDVGPAAYALTDEVNIPPLYDKGLAYILAVELAPEYGVQPSALVLGQALEQRTLIAAHQADVQQIELDPMLIWGARWRGRTLI